ncbi:hypothetical protein CDV31_000788 [Fusarium ambrosium]|uniref:Uncharacterized protein n=1 Tax=Fusarium ambrosium TaxID=131363 RepID=A0A428V170_9HYPO|nr:hypothetical protein CDV31_000788 [Fusarium ambrosium]
MPIGQPEVRDAHGFIRLMEQRTWHHVSLSRDSVCVTPGLYRSCGTGQDDRAAPAHSQLEQTHARLIGRGAGDAPSPVKISNLEAPEARSFWTWREKPPLKVPCTPSQIKSNEAIPLAHPRVACFAHFTSLQKQKSVFAEKKDEAMRRGSIANPH